VGYLLKAATIAILLLLSVQSFLGLLNSVRSNPLVLDSTLNSYAQRHAQEMASVGGIFHSDLSQLDYPYAKAAEIVGRGGTEESVFQAFLDSPAHRAAIETESFTHAGIGIAEAEGVIYVAVVFVEGWPASTTSTTTPPTSAPAPTSPPPTQAPSAIPEALAGLVALARRIIQWLFSVWP
jgi:hypothetical protein